MRVAEWLVGLQRVGQLHRPLRVSADDATGAREAWLEKVERAQTTLAERLIVYPLRLEAGELPPRYLVDLSTARPRVKAIPR